MVESPFLAEYHSVPGITEGHLARFREQRGLRLPDEYVELLKLQNGGLLRNTLWIAENDCRSENRMTSIAGIGPDQCDGCLDILDRVRPIEDKQGDDVSALFVLLYYSPYKFTALDYRDCGPEGEPSVVKIDVLEPPAYFTTIASSFRRVLQWSPPWRKGSVLRIP